MHIIRAGLGPNGRCSPTRFVAYVFPLPYSRIFDVYSLSRTYPLGCSSSLASLSHQYSLLHLDDMCALFFSDLYYQYYLPLSLLSPVLRIVSVLCWSRYVIYCFPFSICSLSSVFSFSPVPLFYPFHRCCVLSISPLSYWSYICLFSPLYLVCPCFLFSSHISFPLL